MKKKETLSKIITIRMNEKELYYLDSQAEIAMMKRSEFIKRAIFSKPVNVLEGMNLEEIRKHYADIARLGNLQNKIVKDLQQLSAAHADNALLNAMAKQIVAPTLEIKKMIGEQNILMAELLKKLEG